MAEIVCRAFEDGDWNEMVRFYEQFYSPGYIFTHREFFDWNFFSPLRPDARSGQRLMLDGDKIIGIMGSLAWPMQVNGAGDIGQYNINLYLDPEYRGHRMGQRLLESTSSGYMYSLTNGFNARTLSMYERLGRVYHWTMMRFTKFLDTRVAEKLIQESPAVAELGEEIKVELREQIMRSAAASLAPPKLLFERVTRFDGEWDAAWERIRAAYGFTSWRDADFLNWRYSDYPFPLYEPYVARRDGEIVGLIVLRVESPPFGRVIRIVDMVCASGEEREMLAFVEATARSRGAVFIDYIFQGLMNSELLEESGYHQFYDRESGAQFLPMDFNPVRHRHEIPILVTFINRQDPACAEIEGGRFYFVKGDGDQDRAN